jgi:hypothetical protein
MRRLFVCVSSLFFSLSASGADSLRYFPPGSLSNIPRSDEFQEKWYSSQLTALGEKSLCCASVASRRTFRFTWLRTFDHPVVIRLEEGTSGNWTLQTKVASGAGGYDPGKLIVDQSSTLSAEKVAPLLKLLDADSAFWRMPSTDQERIGFDGSQWIIEVRHGSRYHFVDRWTPHNDSVQSLGKMFIELSGRTFEKVY